MRREEGRDCQPLMVSVYHSDVGAYVEAKTESGDRQNHRSWVFIGLGHSVTDKLTLLSTHACTEPYLYPPDGSLCDIYCDYVLWWISNVARTTLTGRLDYR